MIIRKVTSDKCKQRVLDHLMEMDAENRRLRFCYPASDESLQKYVESSFKKLNWGNAWFICEDLDGNVKASCHVSFDDKNFASEMGFIVHPDLRGQGMGQKLFKRGLTWGRMRGAKEIYMQCLGENKVVQHIAAKNGMKQVTVGTDKEATLRISNQCRTAAIVNDAVDQCAALYVKAIRQHTKKLEALFE